MKGMRLFVAALAALIVCGTGIALGADGGETDYTSDPPDRQTAPGLPAPSLAEAARLPGGADIAAGLDEYEREMAARDEWLASPEAIRQREQSRLAFADLTMTESEELLRSIFASQLKALNADPSRSLSDAQLVRTLEGSGAVVREEGDTALLESTVPVRTKDEDGELAKVDLSLDATAGGYETRNALSDVRFPDSAEGSVAVGEEGFEISQAQAAESAARRFGDKALFYPEVLADTDLLVAPTSFGAELFNLLRSERSPGLLRFEVDVPAGAELRPDGRGGAEVVRGGETLTRIPTPWALDAQGADVPVTLEVEGSAVLLRVAHREGDYAYPILADPIIEDWVLGNSWQNGQNLDALTNGAWKWDESNNSYIWGHVCCWNGSELGLLVHLEDAFYGPEQYGQWAYSTQNQHVYIPQAWTVPFWRNDNGCGSYQPHDYAGLWNPGDWWNPLQVNKAKDKHTATLEGIGQAVVLGLGTGAPGVWLGCWRSLYVGGVAIWLDDVYGPVIHSLEGLPSGWFSDETQLNLKVNSGDEGLGIKKVELTADGYPEPEKDIVGCDGLYGSRCPNEHSSPFDVTGASFREGQRIAGVVAEDPTGKTASQQYPTWVDYSPPEVTLGGQLAVVTDEDEGEQAGNEEVESLSLPVYNLSIAATDEGSGGNPAGNPQERRSGMKKIEIFLDGEPVKSWEQGCSGPTFSCPMAKSYQLQLSELSDAGEHTLKVVATDQVGETRTRNIEFEYFPATGMKDEYVMHYFPLPDGQGSEAEEEHPARPELAVNVMNGNLVYRERDVDVEGSAVDLEVERYYNSQLPDSENTEWGEGWTLAQTPELKPEEGASPEEAELLDTSGALEEEVALPAEAGAETFDPALQATLAKREGGGYELNDETGEEATSVLFDATGQTEARLTEGYAKVDYSYEGGELAEIAVKDPGSAGNPTEPPEEEPAEEEVGQTPAYSSSFGTNGSGEGQLKSPGDVALDAQGDLWVIDKSNNRVQKFSPEGQYLAKFGTYGTGEGQFNRPTAIAVAQNGDLLVTDAGNGRVQRFSPSGTYISQFGSKGSGNGQFAGSGPEGIAIGEGGEIYVSDTYAGRVQKFTSGGEFIESIGSKGSGEGQIGEPTGIDIDAGGNLWVADWQNNRVEVFDEEGNFLDQFGSAGTGEGQFNRPDALDIDEAGNVWVGDQNNGRVQRFDVAGQYIDQFGSKGSGEGQFSFSYPMGIAASEGHIWIADVNNHRVQEWVLPGATELFTAHAGTLGASGSGATELSSPADVAIDAEGGLWIADRGNDRIQHFDAGGTFVSQFGSTGSGDGQLNAPSGLDLDPEGNVWVADSGNDRIQKFSPEGEFLLKFGSTGTGNGQFEEPVGVAGTNGGGVYVADRGNHRIQLFGKGGGYWGQAGAYGSGENQLIEPSAIALGGPSGESAFTLLIADSGNHRIRRWTWDGKFVSQFGTLGTGKGQLNRPEAVDIDEQGTVWVGDRVNDRIEAFEEDGKSLGGFGSPGTGEGQLELTYPIGIAATNGEILVTDSGNDRLQRWYGFLHSPSGEEAPMPEDDPRVDVETTGGLVASVAGAEAGTHEYAHEGDLLVSHEGPQGETEYEYDGADRLSKVTLPNGTWAEIDYHAEGRVKSVTVDPAGEEPERSATFTYKDDSPRQTTVVPSDAPHVVYEIGDDGSVFKWWNKKEPPVFDYIVGNLYDSRETAQPISPGTYALTIQAHSEEGIASIEVIANGDTLVDEKNCEKEEVIECKTEVNEWVTETPNWAPGHLHLEVIATDRSGESTSRRFWANIPEPPPPPAPGAPVAPTYQQIKDFREEYGLEVVFPVSGEIELNERIFNLVKAWKEGDTPAGQVARATMARWGVPLRPADVAELEYREWFLTRNNPIINQWGEGLHSGEYAGFYMDHRAGGRLRIGFTQEMASRITQLKEVPGLVAIDRIQPFSTNPSHTLVELRATANAAASLNSSQPGLLTRGGVDIASNRVRIGSTDTGQAESALYSLLGGEAPIAVYYDTEPPNPVDARERKFGPLRAGDVIFANNGEWECTAGFGAKELGGKKPNGEPVNRPFLLTAAHCEPGDLVSRFEEIDSKGKLILTEIGKKVRSGFDQPINGFSTDGEAIKLKNANLIPHWIQLEPRAAQRYKGAVVPTIGMILCHSGISSKRARCGAVTGPPEWVAYLGQNMYQVPIAEGAIPGDSGGPVWQLTTGNAVGLMSSGPEGPSGKFKSSITPLLALPAHEVPEGKAPGILAAPGMAPLSLVSD